MASSLARSRSLPATLQVLGRFVAGLLAAGLLLLMLAGGVSLALVLVVP